MRNFVLVTVFLAGFTLFSIAQAAPMQLDSRTAAAIQDAATEENYKMTTEEKSRREVIFKEDLFLGKPAALLPGVSKAAPVRCRSVDSRGRCQN